jgi:acetyl esterase/lipase
MDKASFALLFVGWLMKIRGSYFTSTRFPKWEAKIRQRVYPSPASVPGYLKRKAELKEWSVQGKPVYTLHPYEGRKNVHIIYTHGGAYVLPLQGIHWFIIYQLVMSGASVTVPVYGLAPEHTYRETFSELEAVYRYLLDSVGDGKIVLCGDSAGGGLALAQAVHYRHLGLRAPDRIILFSPWLDITLAHKDLPAFDAKDVMLAIPGLRECGRWWAGGDDPKSPLLSPLNAEMAGLPLIDCFMGTEELLLPDARRLANKVAASGGEMLLYEYPGGFHDIIAATFTPEAKDVFAKVGREISKLSLEN